MVTPASLNGAGCATAVPAASVDASSMAASTVVFIDASLSSLNFPFSQRTNVNAISLRARAKARPAHEVAFGNPHGMTGYSAVPYREDTAYWVPARRPGRHRWVGGDSTSGNRPLVAGPRRRGVALEQEFLDALAVLHLGDVEVALPVHVHVVHDVKLAGRHAVAAERIERR